MQAACSCQLVLFPATFSFRFGGFHAVFGGGCFVLMAYTGAGVVDGLWVFFDGSFAGAAVCAERVGTGEFPQLIRHSLLPSAPENKLRTRIRTVLRQ